MQLSLKALRVNAGFRVNDAAEKMHVTPATIYVWEKRPERLPMGTIVKLCELYKCTPNDIKVTP